MKRLLIGLIAAMLAVVPATAEIKTYEDDYVSFDYDDSVLDIRTYHFYPGTMYNIQYTRDGSSTLANVSIGFCEKDKNDVWGKNLNGEKGSALCDVYMLRRGHEFVRMFDYEKEMDYYRLIAERPDGYLFAILYTNDDTSNAYDSATLTYESAKCTDFFRESGFSGDGYEKAR